MRRAMMLVALLGASALSIVVSGYQQPAAGRGGQGQPAQMVVQADKVDKRMAAHARNKADRADQAKAE